MTYSIEMDVTYLHTYTDDDLSYVLFYWEV